jgi:hypothetical protein
VLISIVGLKVESDLIVEYLNYINQAYCSCVHCFINRGKMEHVKSMVFDARGQAREGEMQILQ